MFDGIENQARVCDFFSRLFWVTWRMNRIKICNVFSVSLSHCTNISRFSLSCIAPRTYVCAGGDMTSLKSMWNLQSSLVCGFACSFSARSHLTDCLVNWLRFESLRLLINNSIKTIESNQSDKWARAAWKWAIMRIWHAQKWKCCDSDDIQGEEILCLRKRQK